MKILGVTITDTLSFEPHVTNVLARCAQTGYARRILRAHGLNGPALWNVTRATLISKLIYASPAWFGFLDESSKSQCQGIIKKLMHTWYLFIQKYLNKQSHHMISAHAPVNGASQCRTIACEKHLFVGSYFWILNTFNLYGLQLYQFALSNIDFFTYLFLFYVTMCVCQWFPTCGPRAKSGPRSLEKWPSTS